MLFKAGKPPCPGGECRNITILYILQGQFVHYLGFQKPICFEPKRIDPSRMTALTTLALEQKTENRRFSNPFTGAYYCTLDRKV